MNDKKPLPISEETMQVDVFSPSGGTLQVKKSVWYMPEWLKAIIALIPALFFLIVFMIYPIINTFLLSFLENFTWVGGSGSSFAIVNWLYSQGEGFRGTPSVWSFQNYVIILKDPSFRNALGNTALMVIVSVPLTIIISLLLAVSLNSIKVLQGFFQTVFFLPYVTNAIALGMVFNVMFSRGGPINSLFGLDFNWLLQAHGATRWSMFAVITTYSVWNGLAFKILEIGRAHV
jgi:multiple sugar transport system permease protein